MLNGKGILAMFAKAAFVNVRHVKFVRSSVSWLLFFALVSKPVSSNATPSTHPGWGATPYGAGGTGVTFRVWAPNAGSVTVKGSFNGFNNVSTPLVSEGTTG